MILKQDIEMMHISLRFQVRMRRKTHLISFSGSLRKKESHLGHHLGAMEDRVGILNALLCLRSTLLDIHAGGEDLIFPHHENEIAQSEAANGVPFSKYWMHNAFLNIDNKKMSKSLGNFFTVRDISREYDLEVLRFFMLSAHYRNPVNFSHDLMESAKNGLDRILTAVDNLRHLSENAKDVPMTEDEKKIIASIDDIYKKFEDSMDDDFNTADAISAIFELVKLANSNSSSDNSKEYIDTLMKKITTLTDILGLKTDKKEEMLDEDIESLIAERQQARKDKNFARADEIRDELLAKGIVLKDTREGVRWSRA